MILVTGGTGLLGSHLLAELVRKNDEVIALKRPSSDLDEVRRVFGYYADGHSESSQASAAELFDRIRWVDADLLNQVDLEEVLQGEGLQGDGQQGDRLQVDRLQGGGQPVEQVYHCAGMVSFQPRDRQRMIRFNTRSTACLVNACLASGVKKLVHVSSSSAIGKSPGNVPATEDLIWAKSKTSTGYAESKFRSEMEVWRGIEEGLNAVIVNPSIILGSGFWDRGSSSMFSRVAKGLKYAAPGVTGYVGVQDVVAAMIRLMDSEISGERFILSEGNYSYKQIFEMIGKALGKQRELKAVSPALLRNLVHLDAFASLFRGGKRQITSEHVRAAYSEVHFSSDKIRETIGMEFTPLDQVIEGVAGLYLKENQL
jgi:nucleoside-diphosphate-sugar epimerase